MNLANIKVSKNDELYKCFLILIYTDIYIYIYTNIFIGSDIFIYPYLHLYLFTYFIYLLNPDLGRVVEAVIGVSCNTFFNTYITAPFLTYLFTPWLKRHYKIPKNPIKRALFLGLPSKKARIIFFLITISIILLLIFLPQNKYSLYNIHRNKNV